MAPEEAKDFVQRAQDMASGPVLRKLTDDLYAWAAARVARKPNASFEEILSEMATYGLGEMAEEATLILERALGTKAGSTGMDTVWRPSRQRGQGVDDLGLQGGAFHGGGARSHSRTSRGGNGAEAVRDQSGGGWDPVTIQGEVTYVGRGGDQGG